MYDDSTSSTYYRVALISSAISAISLVLLLIAVPSIYLTAEYERDRTAMRSERFRTESNKLWTDLVALQLKAYGRRQSDNQQSRNTRSAWYHQTCAGCITLSCQAGPPGPPGISGPEGNPGESGASGFVGDDGYDVQLEPEPDLPCVICPAGPPGARGQQGERGMPGEAGTRGQGGFDGGLGPDGPPGNYGPPGFPGIKGPIGNKGYPGDTKIAGVGIKGPKGPPGAAGIKGPPGIPGKNSNMPGANGKSGEAGPTGPPGNYGQPGPSGAWGPPGEIGLPSTYCPSDCGVSEILAPVYRENRVQQQPSENAEQFASSDANTYQPKQ